MAEQLALDLFAEPRGTGPRCPWLEERYGHPHCYLSMTFRFDCGECRRRGKEQVERWEREEREKKERRRR